MERPESGIVVDGSVSGNPGPGRYKIVDLETLEVLFTSKYFENVTNNQMELFGILHAAYLVEENGWDKIIYSDSQTGIAWFNNKRMDTSSTNKNINIRLTQGLRWAKNREVTVLRWLTQIWGENPADFGKKKR